MSSDPEIPPDVSSDSIPDLEPLEPPAPTQERPIDVMTATIASPDDLETAPPAPEIAADSDVVANEAFDPASTLSPAVRRLVRQYDLDITGIHGTGPSGRIKVSDVIALLGGRAEAPASKQAESARTIPAADDSLENAGLATPYRTARSDDAAPARAATGAFPTTSVFECDVSRVLSHRKQRRQQNLDVSLTSYYLVACSEALKLVPEVASRGGDADAQLGVVIGATDGQTRIAVVDTGDDSPLASMSDRLQALDRGLRAASAPRDVGASNLLVHHYGGGGSVLATPTPIGDGHAASLGIGRVRRQIVVRTVDGDEAPRVAALCYVSLSFHAHQVELARANRFLSQLVRVLEQWPD